MKDFPPVSVGQKCGCVSIIHESSLYTAKYGNTTLAYSFTNIMNNTPFNPQQLLVVQYMSIFPTEERSRKDSEREVQIVPKNSLS